MKDKKKQLGQYFTPANIVDKMILLIENKGSILEPSSGDGAFYSKLPKERRLGVELDKEIATEDVKVMDFFDWTEKVDTIIGNPPYVRYKEVLDSTRKKLPKGFDERSNLYLFFIDRSIDLLNEGGEIIFIVPRDFIKTTSSLKLNKRLYSEGGFTYWEEYGDKMVFDDASPNVAIFRWVKGATHKVLTSFHNGYLVFPKEADKDKTRVYLDTLFDIHVGGASGANKIFFNEKGNIDLVVSTTKRTGKTKKAFYLTKPNDYLKKHKEELLSRKIGAFDEGNWWEWGRKIRHIEGEKIYVNNKTRDSAPFYTHESGWFDGSVLALIPKTPNLNIEEMIEILNKTDWDSQSFKVGGRLIFGQRSLCSAYIYL